MRKETIKGYGKIRGRKRKETDSEQSNLGSLKNSWKRKMKEERRKLKVNLYFYEVIRFTQFNHGNTLEPGFVPLRLMV